MNEAVDEALNLSRPQAWVVAVCIPLAAMAASPINIDEESLATVEAVRQVQIHVIDLTIEEECWFAQQITDSGFVTADADSCRRESRIATHVDESVPSSPITCKHLSIHAVDHWCILF